MTKKTIQELIEFTNTLDESIVITDKNWGDGGPNCVHVNKAFTKLTGYELADVIGKNFRILQGPLSERSVLDRLKKNVMSGKRFVGNTWNYKKDGTPFVMQWIISNIGPKHCDYYYAVQRNITHIKSKEEARLAIKDLKNFIKEIDFFVLGE